MQTTRSEQLDFRDVHFELRNVWEIHTIFLLSDARSSPSRRWVPLHLSAYSNDPNCIWNRVTKLRSRRAIHDTIRPDQLFSPRREHFPRLKCKMCCRAFLHEVLCVLYRLTCIIAHQYTRSRGKTKEEERIPVNIKEIQQLQKRAGTECIFNPVVWSMCSDTLQPIAFGVSFLHSPNSIDYPVQPYKRDDILQKRTNSSDYLVLQTSFATSRWKETV